MKTYHRLTLLSSTVIFIWLFFSAPLTLNAANQESKTSEALVARLQTFYHGIDSLSFSFIQTTKGQMIGRPKKGRGNGIFARTGGSAKMRWNYSSPDQQVLISDGNTISMYFDELNQMIIAPVEQSQADILFSFFAGRGDLNESFSILEPETTAAEEPSGSTNDVEVLSLEPKSPDSQISIIRLWITPDSLIRRIELIDHFDTRTTITISNISIDPFMSMQHKDVEQLFSFIPPEGTEIITQ